MNDDLTKLDMPELVEKILANPNLLDRLGSADLKRVGKMLVGVSGNVPNEAAYKPGRLLKGVSELIEDEVIESKSWRHRAASAAALMLILTLTRPKQVQVFPFVVLGAGRVRSGPRAGVPRKSAGGCRPAGILNFHLDTSAWVFMMMW